MEEVDQIIFDSLVNVGCEFAEGLQNLTQLTTENVVEAAVKCLKVINPDLKMSHLLPPGMSARFRIGSAIAQACQSAGYRDNIGYQTFLYSSETDIRKIFMFLIEKLPRKEGVKEDEEISMSVLKKRIGQVLRNQYSTFWLPLYCASYNPESRFTTSNLVIPSVKQKYQGDRDKLKYVHQQVLDYVELSPSILEYNAASLASQYTSLAKKKDSETKITVSKSSFQWKQPTPISDKVPFYSSFENVVLSLSGASTQNKQSRFAKAKKLQFTDTETIFRKDTAPAPSKPIIPLKPAHLKSAIGKNNIKDASDNLQHSTELNHVGDKTDEISKVEETEEERFTREEEEIKELLLQTEAVQKQHKDELVTLQASVQQMKIELTEIEESVEEKDKNLDLKNKTVYLLPNADESIEKLKGLIEKSSQRLLQLGKMWEEKRIPLINEIRELNEKFVVSEFDEEKKLEEIKEIRKRMKETNDETKRKEQMIKQLMTELESMKRDVSRQSYTKRILEIVSSIHKQKGEIERVIADMKATQKQMNLLKGRIDRTFTAVDEVMFRDAKKDENIRKAYKYLVALHDNCSSLIETVEETGAIMREIRELEDQIENETKKNSEDSLKKILKDYKEMKKENAELMKQIK